jgi:hypothetical protein
MSVPHPSQTDFAVFMAIKGLNCACDRSNLFHDIDWKHKV